MRLFAVLILGSSILLGQQIDWIKQLKNIPYIDVRSKGAKGNGVTSDSAAIQSAVNAACAAGGGHIHFPKGEYRITSTITVSCATDGPANIKFTSSGVSSKFYQDGNFGPVWEFKPYGTNQFVSGIVFDGFTFYRNTSIVLTTGAEYIRAIGLENAEFKNIVFTSVFEGMNIIGGADIKLDHVMSSGVYTQTGGSHYSLKTSYGPSSIRTRIPTHLFFDAVQFNGPRINGPAYQLWITSGETWGFTNSYLGQAKFANIMVEQDATSNSIMLDLDFGPKFYIDGSAGYSVYITGGGVPSAMTWDSVARSGGTGSVDIQNFKFVGGTIKGQEGDSTDCVYVDGTSRGGSYPQAVNGLSFIGVTVEGCNRHGINVQGGYGVRVAASQIHGNNYTNTLNGSGVIVGANTYRMSVLGNKIGGDGWSRGGAYAYQKYGVETVSGAAGFVIGNNDFGDNVTHGLNLGSTNGAVIGYYDGTVWDINRFTDGLLSFARKNDMGSLHVRPVQDAVNQIEIQGSVTGSGPLLFAGGNDSNVNMRVVAKGTGVITMESPVYNTARLLSTLGTPVNGVEVYCSDCTVVSSSDNTCTTGGTGAKAVRLNGAWKCFK